jgi:hypothetical protein
MVRIIAHHLQLVNFHCIFFQVAQISVQQRLSANSACEHFHILKPLFTEAAVLKNGEA